MLFIRSPSKASSKAKIIVFMLIKICCLSIMASSRSITSLFLFDAESELADTAV